MKELTEREIREVLVQNGAHVVSEDLAPIPIHRKRACRKTTGRKVPRPSVSPLPPAEPSAHSLSLSQEPLKEAITTKGTSTLQSSPGKQEAVAYEYARNRLPSERFQSSRFNSAVQKRKGASVASPLNTMRSGRADNGKARSGADGRATSVTNTTNDGEEPYLMQPVSSPLPGLVTQLPVMSMDEDEEGSRLPPIHPSPGAQSRGEKSMLKTSSLPKASGSVSVNRYLWELDEEEDGLLLTDIGLSPTTARWDCDALLTREK